MTTIIQKLTPDFPSDSGSIPTTVWKSDAQLSAPELLAPKNSSNLCKKDADLANVLNGGYSGVTLEWESVVGANFYVVQWCYSPAFHGPTFRAAQVAGTTKALYFGSDIHYGRTIYWRVMAVSNSGATSVKSATWSFVFDCDDINGNPEDIDCKAIDAKLEIAGTTFLRPGESRLYILNASWDRNNRETGAVVTRQSVTWSVRQGGENVAILCQDQNTAILQTKDTITENETIVLEAEVTFLYDAVSSGSIDQTFTCDARLDILVEKTAFTEGRKHGKVFAYLGGNMYLIELVDRIFDNNAVESSSASSNPTSCVEPAVFCDGTAPSYTMDWLESQDDVPLVVVAGDIVCRLFSDGCQYLPVGTDVIIGRVPGQKYATATASESSVSSSASASESEDVTCETNEQEFYWWILAADDGCHTRPITTHVTGVVCAVDCEGNPIIAVATQRVVHVPGTIVCNIEEPGPLSCSASLSAPPSEPESTLPPP
jgi:hypothetical protein